MVGTIEDAVKKASSWPRKRRKLRVNCESNREWRSELAGEGRDRSPFTIHHSPFAN